MEDIILQTVVKMIEEVVEVLLHGGMNNIGAVIQKLQKIANTAVLEIAGAAIEQVDAGVVAASRERKDDCFRIQQRDVPRTVMTEMGELRYQRTILKRQMAGIAI